MGALPSHETHERGLYSHRHGRNRRNEIILIPLTTAFFPSPDCALFQHVYHSRYRRTAKYYFRALRSAQTPRDSDYFCTTTAINEEAEFEKFYKDYLEKREQAGSSNLKGGSAGRGATGAASVHVSNSSTTSSPMMHSASGPQSAGATITTTTGAASAGGWNAVPLPQSPQDCLNAQGLPPRVGPMDFRSYADSREGLYQVLIRDNEPGVFHTDEELRQAYWSQIQEQQTERQRMCHAQQGRRAAAAAGAASAAGMMAPPPPPPSLPHTASGASLPHHGPYSHSQNPLGTPEGTPAFLTPVSMMAMEELSFDDFVSGYAAAKRYMRGKPSHTMHSTAAATDINGDAVTQPADGMPGGTQLPHEYPANHYTHVTAPCAYNVRPLPCVIASRYDPGKPQPVDDPLYVPFGDSYVKIMGIFGFFPATMGLRHATVGGGGGATNDGEGMDNVRPPRRYPRKEGNNNGDEDVDEDVETEQHLLKGTMFVDKDVGDQILGNMVMLATYMYVRQCIEARIHPQAIPMLPVLMRFPLSNIPMLQFVREFRVRLRSLLEAGTAKAGQKPVHTGMSGFNPEDLAEPHYLQAQQLEEEGYLYEPDTPAASTKEQLFMSTEQAASTNAPLRRHAGIHTNACGKYPIIMMSGFNVQSTPLRHPALNSTGYPPAMAATAMVAAATAASSCRGSPQSRSMPASPYTNEMASAVSAGAGTAGGVGRVPTFPPTAPPPPLPGSGSGLNGSSVTAGPPPPPLPPPLPAGGLMGALHVTGATNINNTPPTAWTAAEEARKLALLHRRKQRFRMWVEDGHVCIWASAAYARRAALIMCQQLNTTVDSNSVPEQRSWNYRGLLHAGTLVPPPRHVNDVIIVAEDIPRIGLWQGDVLRCCTPAEMQSHAQSMGMAPLPLPCAPEANKDSTTQESLNGQQQQQHGGTKPEPEDGNLKAAGPPTPPSEVPAAIIQSPMEPIDSPLSIAGSANVNADGHQHNNPSPQHPGSATNSVSGSHTNFTSNHVSNPLLQEKELAAPTAFWVRAAGGLDDSYTNITETNMPPHPKAEKQQLQAAMQRAKKAAAAVAVAQSSGKKQRRGTETVAAVVAASHLFADIDRREGTLNIEEVVLAWIKVVAILTRDTMEEDRAWVRDPQGNPVRVDRYVIRRCEHDGVRFFIGVTPRFVGQQRRIEKVLGEVYAMDERAGIRRRSTRDSDDGGGGVGEEEEEYDEEGGFGERLSAAKSCSISHGSSNMNINNRTALEPTLRSHARPVAHRPLTSLSLLSQEPEGFGGYGLVRGAATAGSVASGADVGAFFGNDLWGAPGTLPVAGQGRKSPGAALIATTATPSTATALAGAGPRVPSTSPASAAPPTGAVGTQLLSGGPANARLGVTSSETEGENAEQHSRLAFAAVFGGADATSTAGATIPSAGAPMEMDDLLEHYKSDALFFGDGDDE